jgi:hypothetical protein
MTIQNKALHEINNYSSKLMTELTSAKRSNCLGTKKKLDSWTSVITRRLNKA